MNFSKLIKDRNLNPRNSMKSHSKSRKTIIIRFNAKNKKKQNTIT